jgi:small-conductance mechanosensitive channel
MLQFGRVCRSVVALVVLGWAGLSAAAGPVEAKSAANVPALPETLTRESARDLLSRLSDEQVRSLLLEQLDRAAKAPVNAGAPGMAAMAGMAGVVDQHAGAMRDRYATLYDALMALPATLHEVASRITESDKPFWQRAGFLAAVLLSGWIGELLYRFALRRYRLGLLHAAAPTYTARAFQLTVELLMDLVGLAIFGVVAIVVFFSFWLGHELGRIIVLEVLFAVIVIRVAALLARFLLTSTPARPRLLPLPDAAARDLTRFAVALAAVYGFGIATASILSAGGASRETVDLLAIAVWFVGVAITLWVVWRVRKPIADLIRGDSGRPILGWLAELWPVAATAYFLTLLLGGVFNLLAGTPIAGGIGIISVVVVVALPIVDMALCRALAAAVASRRGSGTTGTESALIAYEPIFRHVIHILVIVAGLLAIGRLWDLDLFALAQQSLGGKIASSLLGISIVLLATYMLWEIVKAAIDRRLATEGQGVKQDDIPATRLRTVLPILRATILVTIVVMAAMSVLAALGVDILPLLAGAGVVGVAIGFGSQTLVRDIVSGAFFLMDDAFRLGEYIEVGDAKGRVERINLRSVFLRHHRGAINILPYGEIKRLRNTSRDWSIHVMEFRLTYDTNMVQVKKIMKQIGEELSADADYAQDLLQPLKSAGVMAAEDSAIVVRAKFTARPGNNAWVIRRVAYDKIIRAFRMAGIHFAHRQVTVVPASEDAANVNQAGAVAAAALTLEAQGKRTPEKAQT